MTIARANSFSLTLLFFLLLTGGADVQASAGGRSGFSGDPSTNAGASCTLCHAPSGVTPPEITVFGADTVEAGATQNFIVVMKGGAAQTAGIDISVQNGVGELLPLNDDLQLLNGELTHTEPKEFGDDVVAFGFRYTAPNYNAEVSLYVAGNSTDGKLDLLHDSIATTALDIAIVNGFEEPPEPPAAAGGELSISLFATGFERPVVIVNAGDERLFVAEQPGVIRVVESDGAVPPRPFLDIESQVDDSANEMGLLGMVFHPDYVNNGYFYVYYTFDPGSGNDRSRVSRFTVSSDADIADPDSELVLLEFEQPYGNHNGGDLHFGPAGYLHIGVGDGGSAGDPQNNSQTTTELLGKMLRIDVDPPATVGAGPDCDISGHNNYSIPSSNAFNDGVGGAGCDEIFVMGVRNPWRFTFDRETDAMWIADVGQNEVEEINYLPPGDGGGINLGWRCFEGNSPFKSDGCNRVYLPPVHTYANADSGCSVTGGRVYRGERSPDLQGQYFFTDFCQSSIRALSGSPGELAHRIVIPLGELSAVSTFGEDSVGELYVAELNSGDIYRLTVVSPPGS